MLFLIGATSEASFADFNISMERVCSMTHGSAVRWINPVNWIKPVTLQFGAPGSTTSTSISCFSLKWILKSSTRLTMKYADQMWGFFTLHKLSFAVLWQCILLHYIELFLWNLRHFDLNRPSCFAMAQCGRVLGDFLRRWCCTEQAGSEVETFKLNLQASLPLRQ